MQGEIQNIFDLFTHKVHNRLNKLQSYSLPSAQYIDLTLGASGSIYTAPADGYFYLAMDPSANAQYINIEAGAMGTRVHSSLTSFDIKAFLPVKKGYRVYITYNTGGTINRFRFIYANGSQPA